MTYEVKETIYQPPLKKHILQELTELENLVRGYKTAITNHPQHQHKEQIHYIERFIARILYSVEKNY
jgi:hypothetical protein